MSIKSMTGFAREAGEVGPHRWAWELKTVNGRGLDVRLRTPPGFDSAGEEARKALAGALTRGQCQLTLTVAKGAAPARVRVNRSALLALLDSLDGIDLPETVRPASLDGLLAVRGVVELDEGGETQTFDEQLQAAIAEGARRLVAALQGARAGEGAALGRILLRQLDEIEALVGAAEAAPARQPDAIRDRLASQVAALLGASSQLDPSRLHQEAALLATRGDIREEIDRLRAHLASARALLAEGGAIGRRLDFLSQELGRETNTLCAKANDVSLSRMGLDMKAVVEQFREQVQNVE